MQAMILFCVLTSTAVMAGSDSQVTTRENGTAERRSVVAVDQVDALLRASDRITAANLISSWRSAPPYQKLAIAERLLTLLNDETPLAALDVPLGQEEDTAVCGRTAWGLAQLLGARFPTSRQASANMRPLRREVAVAAIQGYRQALIDGLRNTEMMKDAIALKLQYREKIQAGLRGDSVQLGASAFADLLDQWQPIGRSEAGLVELAGSGKKSDKGVVYRFDSGMGGIQFDVLTKDGVIWSVVPRGIE